jgi:flagellin
MRVHGETTTLAAVRYFQSDNNVVNKTLQNLSSGKRITSAADDAAGLAVSQKLVAHIKGFNQANRNIQDGFSMLQTAEGGLEELTSMLQRMRILAVQSTNGTLSDEDRNLLNEEVTQLRDEIQRTAETVNFNGLELLTGYINWQELEIDPTKTNVCDAGLVGNADFGIYDVHLDISAVEQQQTSGIKTGTFVENEGLNSGTDTMANATVAAGKYVYSGGNWLTDFSSINIEMMHKLTADGTNLKEGTDFTYTNSSNGVNESTGILNLI